MKSMLPGLTIALFFQSVLSQTVVSIPATRDCGLYETDDGSLSNGAGQFLFVGKLGPTGGEKKRRALIHFDLGGKIPAGATIDSVQVVIHVSKVKDEIQRTNTLFRLTADWGEGTSNGGSTGAGAASTTGDATWIHSFFNTVSWTTPGSDFSATASSSAALGAVGGYTFNSTAAMVSDVQSWIANASSNFGWIVIGDEADPNSMKVIDSRENAVEGNRPILIVKYSVPNTAAVHVMKPNIFSLYQNYPNPFNPSTAIRYSIPAAGHVSLKIFDVLGNEIATVVNEVKSAGIFTQQWNASGIPSGIYFYRLQTEYDVSTKKLMLIK